VERHLSVSSYTLKPPFSDVSMVARLLQTISSPLNIPRKRKS